MLLYWVPSNHPAQLGTLVGPAQPSPEQVVCVPSPAITRTSCMCPQLQLPGRSPEIRAAHNKGIFFFQEILTFPKIVVFIQLAVSSTVKGDLCPLGGSSGQSSL